MQAQAKYSSEPCLKDTAFQQGLVVSLLKWTCPFSGGYLQSGSLQLCVHMDILETFSKDTYDHATLLPHNPSMILHYLEGKA